MSKSSKPRANVSSRWWPTFLPKCPVGDRVSEQAAGYEQDLPCQSESIGIEALVLQNVINLTSGKFFNLNGIKFRMIRHKHKNAFYICRPKDHMKALLSLLVRNHAGRLLFSARRCAVFRLSFFGCRLLGNKSLATNIQTGLLHFWYNLFRLNFMPEVKKPEID